MCSESSFVGTARLLPTDYRVLCTPTKYVTSISLKSASRLEISSMNLCISAILLLSLDGWWMDFKTGEGDQIQK